MNSIRKITRLIAALLGLVLPMVLVGMTLSLGYAQEPEDPFLVKDIWPGATSSDPDWLTAVNDTLLFSADDGTHGRGLWKSDSTPEGTVLVKDIDPEGLTAVNGTLFFSGDDGTHGVELWKSDGTPAGTVMVKDINLGPASSYCGGGLTTVNGTLFFSADDGTHGCELWKSDGTEPSTVLVKDINLGSNGSWPLSKTAVGSTLFFRADDGTHNMELWKSDGTEAGTVLVKDINPGPDHSSVSYLTDVNGTLLFSADDGTHGRELWKSDGTEAGTVMVKDINPGPGSSWVIDHSRRTTVNSMLFFSADDGTHGVELWKSDGTEAGTAMVKDINPWGWSYPERLTNVKGVLLLSADDGTHGVELWRSDGTEVGTVLVKDINPGPEPSGPHSYLPSSRGLTVIDGTIFFGANDGTHGSEFEAELWKSDGTEAGTVLVKDIVPGTAGSNPDYMTDVDGILFFYADDGTHGRELWVYVVLGDLKETTYLPIIMKNY